MENRAGSGQLTGGRFYRHLSAKHWATYEIRLQEAIESYKCRISE